MPNPAEKNRSVFSNQSTEKALSIIEFLSEHQTAMRLTDIAEKLDINTSTALRFLSSLQNCGYIAQQEDNKKYYLTYKICRIANNIIQRNEFQTITHPYLLELSELFQESLCISIEKNMEMVYVDVATGPGKTLMSFQQIGNTAPMHCTGNGKLLLTTFSDEKIDRLIHEKGLKQYTQNTITTKEELVKALAAITEAGYATDDEESEVGVRCIAYPIRNYSGQVFAGISITCPAQRLTMKNISLFQKKLEETAVKISAKLGYEEQLHKTESGVKRPDSNQ